MCRMLYHSLFEFNTNLCYRIREGVAEQLGHLRHIGALTLTSLDPRHQLCDIGHDAVSQSGGAATVSHPST